MNNILHTEKQQDCGLNATIINYKHPQNIDVQWEDGSVTKKTTFKSFFEGQLNHPILSTKRNCQFTNYQIYGCHLYLLK